jgi:excisionase family DNA binding protein
MVDGPAVSGIPSGGPSGSDRHSDRQEYYTVSEAAKVLDISERRVRQIAQDGKVEGVRSEDGWKLFRYSVHDFRDRREAQTPVRAVRGGREPSSEAREWIERVHGPRERTWALRRAARAYRAGRVHHARREGEVA